MQFKFLALAGLAGSAAAQSLVQALNGTSDLSNLTAIVAQYPSVVSALSGASNITLLAPNNNAIAAFLAQATMNGSVTPSADTIQAILTYHVLAGTYQNFSANATFMPTLLTAANFTSVTGGQRVEVMNSTIYSGLRDNSSIVGSSINFTGGVIHVIDRVLTVPESPSDTAIAYNLTSFYGALNESGQINTIDKTLKEATIFVPNNAAFQAIGSALPSLNMTQLLAILSYHVISGTVAYSTTLKNMTVPSLEGANLTISIKDGAVFVNNARVVIPDVLVSNGVIHVIDEVLNPFNATATSGNSTAGAPAFSGASSVSEAPFTSGQPTPTSSRNTAAVASSATATSSSSKAGAWAAKATGAIGAAAVGGLALLMQL